MTKKFGERLKKGCQKFCRTNRKYFRGHPKASLASGIQDDPTASARHWADRTFKKVEVNGPPGGNGK